MLPENFIFYFINLLPMKFSTIKINDIDGKPIEHKIHQIIAQGLYTMWDIADLDLARDMYADKDVTISDRQKKSILKLIENPRLEIHTFTKKAIQDFLNK